LRGALAAAEGIGDERRRAEALSGVASAMTQTSDEARLLAWTQNAFAWARPRGHALFGLKIRQH